MRPILADGKPYPRRRPVQWDYVMSVLRYRKDRRDKLRRGLIPVDPTKHGFALFDAIRQQNRRIEAVEISADGTMLYVRLSGEAA